MALIKHSNAGEVLKNAVVLDLGDLARQAERMKARAREEAAQIVEDAKAEACDEVEQLRETARQEGYEAGLAAGREEGTKQATEETLAEFRPRVEALIERWDTAVGGWETDRREMLLATRDDVIAFGLEVARKVVHRVVRADPQVVIDQVGEALRVVARPTSAAVSVHPEDRPLVDAVLAELVAAIRQCEHVTLREDATIERGGCVVDAAGGQIDATIDVQLERISDALLAKSTLERWSSIPATST